MKINGNQCPVTGYVESETLNIVVPVVDLPLMSDERWRELTETPENRKRVEEAAKMVIISPSEIRTANRPVQKWTGTQDITEVEK